MNALKKLFGGNTRQFGMIFALVALIIFFQFATEGRTLTPGNVINLFNGNSYILILAIGMVLVIIAGHIDLSVGSLTAFIGAFAAVLTVSHHVAWPVALVLCLLMGAVAGSIQGFLIGRPQPIAHYAEVVGKPARVAAAPVTVPAEPEELALDSGPLGDDDIPF